MVDAAANPFEMSDEEDEPDEDTEDEDTDDEDPEDSGKSDVSSKAAPFSDKENDTAATTKEVDVKDDKTTEVVDNVLDYEAEYKKLLSPFKASGRQVQINNVDEAVQLMQMGADYNKKMAGLKPSLKLLKMLENNELLDEGKISYLIDLDKKNPEAITKLIKESGIDPLEVDVNADTEYKPNTYTVNDGQLELDRVLDDIKETDSFNDTMEIVGNKWDESSKRALWDKPEDLVSINVQVGNGIYKQIDTNVQNQRMLGNLKGLSDIDAYRAVGTFMQENRLFEGQTPKPNPPADVIAETTNTDSSPELKDRKKAASTTNAAPSKKKSKNNYNPLALSDEEFEKVTTPQT
jgi:hypothetical protein